MLFLTCCDCFVNTSIFFFTEKSITCEEKYFSSHVRKIFHTLLLKSHLEKDSAYQHTDLVNAIQEKLRKTFCCYNCLDLYHAQSFFQVFVTCFPSSLKQKERLEKGHKFSAYGLKLAQPFLNTIFLLSRTGKKSNSH